MTRLHYETWTNKILLDYKNGLLGDIEQGFNALEREKSFGGLDYSVFFEGAKAIQEDKPEKAWQECLKSAKCGGNGTISARSAKVLNSMGGMNWLRDADPEQVNWQRKEFIEIYENTPEPFNLDFRCEGLEASMYLEVPEKKLLE